MDDLEVLELTQNATTTSFSSGKNRLEVNFKVDLHKEGLQNSLHEVGNSLINRPMKKPEKETITPIQIDQ